MVNLTDKFKGKKVILLGAGVSNMPLARMLSAMGAEIEVRDKKTEEEMGERAEELKSLGAVLVLGDDYLSPMTADFVFRSPGFRPDMPVLNAARDAGITVTSEMEMFAEYAPCPVIGITGSDGKSTTTTLVSKILEAENKEGRKVFLGGNIGEPLLNRISDMKEDDIVAAEMSSFQLMTVHSPLAVAVIKNVTPNHLNWHTGMDEYIEAKAKILDGAGCAVLNYDDEVCRRLGETCKSPVIWFSRKPIPEDFLDKYFGGVYDKNGVLTMRKTSDKTEVAVVNRADIVLPGDHNAENYSTAIAATVMQGYADIDAVVKTAKTFPGVRHRFEFVGERGGARFYNSSIDSSPTRTAAAISNVSCPIRIICGGYDKKIPFEPLAEALISRGNVRTVVLTGATAEKIREAIVSHPEFKSSGIELLMKPDFKDAVIAAADSAESGDAVLLSPACASFDAFENFEKRGERFKEIAEEIGVKAQQK